MWIWLEINSFEILRSLHQLKTILSPPKSQFTSFNSHFWQLRSQAFNPLVGLSFLKLSIHFSNLGKFISATFQTWHPLLSFIISIRTKVIPRISSNIHHLSSLAVLKIYSSIGKYLRRVTKGLRRWPGSNPTRCPVRLGDPTSLRGSRWLSGRRWIASVEWGCPLDNGPKFAVGLPNNSCREIPSYLFWKILNFQNKNIKWFRFYFFVCIF